MLRDERDHEPSDDSVEGAPVAFIRSGPSERPCVLEVRGDLDIAVSGLLERELEELLDRGTGQVDVDLSGVLFMDSSALSALVHAHRRAQATGQDLNLIRPSAACTKVLSITGLDRVFAMRG
jgi:anti-sigma B factor antagonist